MSAPLRLVYSTASRRALADRQREIYSVGKPNVARVVLTAFGVALVCASLLATIFTWSIIAGAQP